MMSFITEHIISLIKKEILKRKDITGLNVYHFFYFNEVLIDGDKKINRVSLNNPHESEKIIPLEWWEISPKTVLTIYDKIKSNDFYFYKVIDGKSYKARIK